MPLTRTLNSLVLAALMVLFTVAAQAESNFPSGCLCKDAFKKVTLEITDPTPPYKKRKTQQIKQVKGLLHCYCGKQECVVAAPIEREQIHMSCTER